MERTFRLEFNENQQCFHFNHGEIEENTFGWITIFESCTELEYNIYECYVNRIKKEKLTIEYLKECAVEIVLFMNNLIDKQLQIISIAK